MKDKKLNELKKPVPTIEEQLAFIDDIRVKVRANTEKMKRDNPDVMQWIKDGKPKLTPELNIKYDNIMKAKELNDFKQTTEAPSVSTRTAQLKRDNIDGSSTL